jgi:hypothetical protein
VDSPRGVFDMDDSQLMDLEAYAEEKPLAYEGAGKTNEYIEKQY